MPTISSLPAPLWVDGDSPRVRVSDRFTSHVAADSNAGRVAVEGFVWRLFQEYQEGFTDEELTEAYARSGGPLTHQDSPRKRRSDLAARGVLVESGVTRPTRSGRAAVVWVLAPAAVGS